MQGTLVIGCARSGTKYCAVGLGLGHERMGPNGCSSWLMGAWQCRRFRLPSPNAHGYIDANWRPRRVIHVVRDPLKVVSSIVRCVHHGWLAWAQTYCSIGYPRAGVEPFRLWNEPPVILGKSRIRFAMRYWLRWNRLCEWSIKQYLDKSRRGAEVSRVRVEDLAYHEVSKATNRRTHDALTWGQLLDASPARCRHVINRMREYGYEPEVIV